MKKLHLSMINLWCNKNLVDSQLFLWKLLSENPDKVEYFSDPYDSFVEIVILNTCSFISSGREEMFQTVEKLLSKKKKVCIIWCGVQYFEKLVRNKSPFGKGDAPKEQGDIYKKLFLAYNPNLTAKARELRKNMTEAEKKLRYKFLQPLDIKVLRQQPIDKYIVDFYVASKKLVIEIDGDTHWTDDEIKYDEKRTKILNNLWLTVIRFTNDEVYNNFESVCWKIEQYLKISPLNPPLTKGGVLQLQQEFQKREKMLENPNISYLSRNDLTLANLQALTSRSQTFDDFCRYSAPRLLTNYENRYEYLKIAEWCNNSCAFCIIPQIRWKLTSLPIQSIISQAEDLLKQWIEELIIIAQDTMRYGTDFSSSSQLLPLLHQLDKLPYEFKYRILYLYPDILTLKQLEEFATLEKFIPYFDIPFQHISPKLLKSMWRFYNDKMIHTLLKSIRSLFPDSFIRTNIIVWFPWETDEDMKLLQSFLDEDYFDNIALFEYHDEPLAKSSIFENKVPDSLIHSRFKTIRWQVDKLLKAREKKRKWKNQIGFVEWIREERGQIFLSIRPEIHCPEIDPVDEVRLENVIQCFDGEEIEIGSKVEYMC